MSGTRGPLSVEIDDDGEMNNDSHFNAPTQAAVKAFGIQHILGNIFDLRGSVRAVGTSNVTLSGEQTIDGVDLVAGDRILLTGQTNSTQNGVYEVAEGAWARWSEADSNADLTIAFTVNVDEPDSAHNHQFWILVTPSVDVGVTTQLWIPVDSLAPTLITIVIQLATVINNLASFLYFGSGDPEGVSTAVEGALFIDDTGALWIKTAGGFSNTGWHQVATL